MPSDAEMTRYLVLLRGINGVARTSADGALDRPLEDLGYSNVATYIASGNVMLSSDRPADEVKRRIEEALPVRSGSTASSSRSWS